jgi:hypothetical protein
MTIDLSGLDAKVRGGIVSIPVCAEDCLIGLANKINWEALYSVALQDLKNTKLGFYNVGRKIQIRTHLGAYVLQSMHNETDRSTEQRIKGDARWRVFCGEGIVTNWRAPDHTKIETFRNRLSASTHQLIGQEILKCALEAGFTKPEWMDVDSTVQEANISYPSDATLMTKLASKAAVLGKELKEIGKDVWVDIAGVKEKAKEYFFLAKNAVIEKKRKVFSQLHTKVVSEIVSVTESMLSLAEEDIEKLSQKAQAAWDLILCKGLTLLEDIRIFIKTHSMVPSKILSLHAEKVACICKGKLGKPHEFGRVFQLGRLPGNFMIVGKSKSVQNSDKSAIGGMIYAHAQVFGAKTLESLGTDKSYHSEANVTAAKAAGVREIAIQQPSSIKNGKLDLKPERKKELENRRAGIEPLIGHCKKEGLSRSRMKSDSATESSAYRCVTGFNLRQMSRHIQGCYN